MVCWARVMVAVRCDAMRLGGGSKGVVVSRRKEVEVAVAVGIDWMDAWAMGRVERFVSGKGLGKWRRVG